MRTRLLLACVGTALLVTLGSSGQVLAQVELQLRADREDYRLGEPVVLYATLRNEGPDTVSVIPRLTPEYGFTRYTVTGPHERPVLQPVVMYDIRPGELTSPLPPGDSVTALVKVFFGSSGWMLAEPGSYRVRAEHLMPAGVTVVSEPLTLDVHPPSSDEEQRAADRFLTRDVGLFLLWEGGDQFTEAIRDLRKIARRLPQSRYAAYANFALGMNLTVDQGSRPADPQQAQLYLERAREASDASETTGYLRGAVLTELWDLYGITGDNERREEIRRELREEIERNPGLDRFVPDLPDEWQTEGADLPSPPVDVELVPLPRDTLPARVDTSSVEQETSRRADPPPETSASKIKGT